MPTAPSSSNTYGMSWSAPRIQQRQQRYRDDRSVSVMSGDYLQHHASHPSSPKTRTCLRAVIRFDASAHSSSWLHERTLRGPQVMIKWQAECLASPWHVNSNPHSMASFL